MVPLDSKETRKVLEDILSKDEYQVYYRESKNLFQVFMAKLKDWVNEILVKLLGNIHPSKQTLDFITYSIIAVGVLLILLLFILLIRKFVRQRSFKYQPVGINVEHQFSSEGHLLEADKLANDEKYNLALRHVFLALLLHLDHNKIVEVKPWKTNWEYYDEIRRFHSILANSFYDLAITFDEAMYGGKIINKHDYFNFFNQAKLWIDKQHIVEGQNSHTVTDWGCPNEK